jgi:hypothetical protein
MPKIAANFELGSPQPIDSRLVVEDDSVLSSLIKYEGLEVYVKSTGLKKIYNGSDWVDFTADIATHYIDDKDQKQSINSQIKALVEAIDALSDDSGDGLATITTSLTNLQTAWDKFMNGTDTDTVIDTMNEIRLELDGKEDVGNCAPLKHEHTKDEITDFPTSLPASDVSDWAKETTKPTYNWTEIDGKPTTFPPETHAHEQYLTAKDIAGKAEATALVAHTSDSANPHSVTKDQLGLSDVRNVSSYSKDETDVLLEAKQDKGDYATKEELEKLDNRTTNMGEVVKTNTASIQSNASAISKFTTKLNNMGNSVSAHGKAISNIEGGTTTVKKAEQDSDGNNIVSTYATKDELTDGSLQVGAIQDQCELGSSGLYLDDVFDLEKGMVNKAIDAEVAQKAINLQTYKLEINARDVEIASTGLYICNVYDKSETDTPAMRYPAFISIENLTKKYYATCSTMGVHYNPTTRKIEVSNTKSSIIIENAILITEYKHMI